MASKDRDSPATTSSAHDLMSPRWGTIDALLGGTESMRAAGEMFLPIHPEETNAGYQERLSSATLLNMTEQTLDNLSGKPFSEDIKVNDDVPKEIQDKILYDVDLQGNNLNVFCRQWFREGVAKAFCHVLVDMPRPQPAAEGKARTLDDDRKEGLRPYWVMVKPECVLFARAEIENGAEVLKHVRILETYTVQDGFAEVTKARIRVLEPGHVALYEPHPTKKRNDEPVWELKEEWDTALDYIPLVTFYAHREGFMMGKPPLLDLAHLNIAHWQSSADQRHILTVARFPILACSGATADDGDPVIVGPNKVLYNNDPAGRFYYVEHTGAAIDSGRQDLLDLKEEMAGYGTQFLKKQPGTATATGRALDSAESISSLAAMVTVAEDAIAQALDITAEWMRLTQEGGSVELVKTFELSEDETKNLDQIQKARSAREISRKAYLNALVLAGVLPEDFNADEDEQNLLDEQSSALGKAMFNLDPAGGNTPPLPDGGKPAPEGAPPAGAPAKPDKTTKKPKPKPVAVK